MKIRTGWLTAMCARARVLVAWCVVCGGAAWSPACRSAGLEASEVRKYRGTARERASARSSLRRMVGALPRCLEQAIPLYEPIGPDKAVEFGDEINCPLFRSMVNKDKALVTHLGSLPRDRQLQRPGKLLMAGTVLRSAQPSDVVVGAGGEDRMGGIPASTAVYSVRGAVTLAKLGEADRNFATDRVECLECLGDPALLAWLLIPDWFDIEVTGGDGACVVPHGADEHLKRFVRLHRDRVRHITHTNGNATALEVATQLATCDVVISSSLHGIIFADALGIPSILPHHWAFPPFKALDYLSAAAPDQADTFVEAYREERRLRSKARSPRLHLHEPWQAANISNFIFDRDCRLNLTDTIPAPQRKKSAFLNAAATTGRLLPKVPFRRRVALAEAYVRSFPISRVCYVQHEDIPPPPNPKPRFQTPTC